MTLTTMLALAPAAIAMTLTEPAALAVTNPVDDTDAMVESLVDQETAGRGISSTRKIA